MWWYLKPFILLPSFDLCRSLTCSFDFWLIKLHNQCETRLSKHANRCSVITFVRFVRFVRSKDYSFLAQQLIFTISLQMWVTKPRRSGTHLSRNVPGHTRVDGIALLGKLFQDDLRRDTDLADSGRSTCLYSSRCHDRQASLQGSSKSASHWFPYAWST